MTGDSTHHVTLQHFAYFFSFKAKRCENTYKQTEATHIAAIWIKWKFGDSVN